MIFLRSLSLVLESFSVQRVKIITSTNSLALCLDGDGPSSIPLSVLLWLVSRALWMVLLKIDSEFNSADLHSFSW